MAVRVDVERHLDLGNSARRRRQTDQVEAPERAVVPGELALSLKHVDLDAAGVGRGGEGLALARGIVVLRSMSLVMTAPRVSTPSDSGVTSRSRRSLTSPRARRPAPRRDNATTSSGLTPLCGSLPKYCLNQFLDPSGCGCCRRPGRPRRFPTP